MQLKRLILKIKTKVLAYESDTVNRDIFEELYKEIKKHTKVKNLEKVSVINLQVNIQRIIGF